MSGKKILYALLGLLCTGLAIIGVWVPGVPTTIFVLIAMWAFSAASPRLYRWFTRIPLLKSALREAQRFQREGTIDPRVKLISQSCAWISFAATALLNKSLVITITVGLLAVSCSVFMTLTPSTTRSKDKLAK